MFLSFSLIGVPQLGQCMRLDPFPFLSIPFSLLFDDQSCGEVVQDGNLITSRQPSDLPAFTDAVISALGGVEASGLGNVTEKTGPLEALQMAIHAEEAAHRFYSIAVQKTTDPEAKNVFHRLAQEEERHRTIVQDEYSRLTMNPDWDRYRIWREVL